jgi:hypothetical protein
VKSIPDFPEVARRTALSAYRRVANANSSANLRLTAQEDLINVKPYHVFSKSRVTKSLLALKILFLVAQSCAVTKSCIRYRKVPLRRVGSKRGGNTVRSSSSAFVATPRVPALPLEASRSGDDIWEQVTCRQHAWEYQKSRDAWWIAGRVTNSTTNRHNDARALFVRNKRASAFA